MTLKIANWVRQMTTTTGTGTLSLIAPATGDRAFSASQIGSTNTSLYVIDDGIGNKECGLGTVTIGTPDTLSRDAVYDSTNGGALVNFPAGIKTVVCDVPADRRMWVGTPLTAGQIPTSDGVKFVAGGPAPTFFSSTGLTIGGSDNGARLNATQSIINQPGVRADCTNTAFTAQVFESIGYNATMANYTHFLGYDNSTAATGTRIQIFGNGNIQNFSNSYGAISDGKLKENFVKAASQWADTKALAALMVNYNFIADPDKRRQLGLVAQDVQKISPGLVYATDDVKAVRVPLLDDEGEVVLDGEGPVMQEVLQKTGDQTLGLHTSVLLLKGFKTLGEAQERVEALESEVDALKSVIADIQSRLPA